MADVFRITTPIDGSVVAERRYASPDGGRRRFARAAAAQPAWARLSVEERSRYCKGIIAGFAAKKTEIAEELTRLMGRPIRDTPGEVSGLIHRARHMIDLAPEALADLPTADKPGFERFVRRVPHGVVLVLAPWNYPYLTAVNAIIPALMAGNTVVLKHADQTALCAERFAEAFASAGLPEGVFQYLHMDHATTARLIEEGAADYVAFTGSVEGGLAVQRAARTRFIPVGLELGGKDPAYVRPDADFEATVANLVEGVYYNAGQSCCAVERIYVHEGLYARFVEAFVEGARAYRLGDPLDVETTLGPMVRTANADGVRAQTDAAVAAGARALIDPALFPASRLGTPYLHPQVLIDVDHTMAIMTEETFGPVVGIMPVASDAEALALMNDSRYGLTASVWTQDREAALALAERIETGTCFMNRCDYLDPALAWTGTKDSGRGGALSRIGYEQLTRPKSFHFRLNL